MVQHPEAARNFLQSHGAAPISLISTIHCMGIKFTAANGVDIQSALLQAPFDPQSCICCVDWVNLWAAIMYLLASLWIWDNHCIEIRMEWKYWPQLSIQHRQVQYPQLDVLNKIHLLSIQHIDKFNIFSSMLQIKHVRYNIPGSTWAWSTRMRQPSEPESTVCVFVNLPLTSHILGIARGTGGARRALICIPGTG